MSLRRWTAVTASLVSAGLLAAALTFAIRLLAIGTAYKAKMMCSDVFVAGRQPDQAQADLELDDLKPLRIIDTTVNRSARTAKATSLFGAVAYHAQFRGEAGCALMFDGVRLPPLVSASGQRSDERPDPLSVKAANQSDDRSRRLEAVLDAAFSEPDREHLRRTRAIVVVHGGQIVAERYSAGIGPDTPLLGWSMTKSVVNALVGILVKDGRLSLDAPPHIEAWSAPGDPRRRITLDQLMHMSSGLRFDEDMATPLTDVTAMLLRRPDMAAFATSKELEADPGSRWQYSSGTSVIISRAIRSALGDEEYRRFPRSPCSIRLACAAPFSKRMPAARSSVRRSCMRLHVTGRASACCTCRTESGAAPAFCRRAGSHTPERRHPRTANAHTVHISGCGSRRSTTVRKRRFRPMPSMQLATRVNL